MMTQDPTRITIQDERNVIVRVVDFKICDIATPRLVDACQIPFLQQVIKPHYSRTISRSSCTSFAIYNKAVFPAEPFKSVSPHKHRINFEVHIPATHRWMVISDLTNYLSQIQDFFLMTTTSP